MPKKQIAITADVHERAKAKADRVGMKLYRFIEAAVEAFDPKPAAHVSNTPRGKRVAGLR